MRRVEALRRRRLALCGRNRLGDQRPVARQQVPHALLNAVLIIIDVPALVEGVGRILTRDVFPGDSARPLDMDDLPRRRQQQRPGRRLAGGKCDGAERGEALFGTQCRRLRRRRGLLDAAAEAVGMDATALVAWQLTEERGLGELRDSEAEYNRWIDDKYESETTIRRNNHEREVARTTAAVYGLFGPAGLTDAEEVEVVRRFFRRGDASLSKAEGRALKAALAMPSPIDAKPITYGDSGEDLTIRISGTAYANLATMAKAMNGVDWCDNDNTPATVASNFVIGDIIGDLAEPTRMSRNIVCGGCGEIALYIVESIDTGCDGETNEHKRRVEELRTALLAALPTAGETSGANT